MRPLFIVCLCVGALAGGALLAYFLSTHFLAVTQAVDTSSSVYSVVQSLPGTGTRTSAVTRPATIPAHPNWTWNMPSGKVYQDVVITDLSPTEVTITHSLGVAHLHYDELPPEVLNELRPGSAAANPAAAGSAP